MPVPDCDILCRFIRPRDWSSAEERPKASAFKQADLSVWHKSRLIAKNIRLEDLRIEHLEGYGQAHYTAGDFRRFAKETSELDESEFRIEIEWRPEDECVEEQWREWNYAHVQVEIDAEKQFLTEFRRKLAFNARETVPPDGQKKSTSTVQTSDQ